MSKNGPPISTKAALLQALTDGEGHGYGLIERVRELTAGRLQLHQGSVYPALNSLKKGGYIKKVREENKGIVFDLTEKGKVRATDNAEVVKDVFGLTEEDLLDLESGVRSS